MNLGILERYQKNPHKLAYLCGAGISAPNPSCLPLATEFLRTLSKYVSNEKEYQEIIIGRLYNGGNDDESDTNFLRFETVMASIAMTIDPNLDILNIYGNCAQPNPYHYFLAKQLQRGCIIMTTNFDNLIELACSHLSIKYINIVEEEEFITFDEEQSKNQNYIIKLHGSFNLLQGTNIQKKGPVNIKATLHQVGQYFPDFKRTGLIELLSQIFEKRHVCVLGYSGCDDFDIVPILERIRIKKGITWIEHNPLDSHELLTQQSSKATTSSIPYRLIAKIDKHHPQKMNTLLQGDTAKLLKISFPNTEIQSYDWISTFNAWRKKYLNEPNSQRLLLASIFSTLYIRQYSSKLLAEIDINLLNNSQVAYYSFLRACDYYYSGELEKAIRYFSDCIMNDQLQDQLVKGFSYYNLARINTDSDNFDIADVYLSKSLSIFLEEMDWVRLSDCLHEVGRVNSLTGHEERGIDFLTMSGEICEKIGDLNGAAMSYHGIAVANYRLNNIVEAEKFLDKAGNIFSLTFDKQGSFLVHHLRGMLEAKNGSFDVAEKHYRKAIELEKEIDASLDLAHTMHNLADILISKGEYEEAKTLLNQSINIKMQYEDQEGIRNSKILLRTIQSIENLRYKLY